MSVAPLRFTDHGGIDSLLLLEVPESLLTDLKAGQVLYVRGQPDHDAVVCTASSSYLLRQTETSNTCLLVPEVKTTTAEAAAAASAALASGAATAPADRSNAIAGIVTCHYDLVPIPPRTAPLRTLFSPLAPFTAAHDKVLQRLESRKLAAKGRTGATGPTTQDIDEMLGFSADNDDNDNAHASLASSSSSKRSRHASSSSSSSSARSSASSLPVIAGRTLRDLRHLVQASEADLRAAMSVLPLLRVGGAFCRPSAALVAEVALNVTLIVGHRGLDLARINPESVISELRSDGVCSMFTAAHVLYQFRDAAATDALNAKPVLPPTVTPAADSATGVDAAATAAEAERARATAEAALAVWETVQRESLQYLDLIPLLAQASAEHGDGGAELENDAPFAPSLRLPRRIALCPVKLARHRAAQILAAKEGQQMPAAEFMRYGTTNYNILSYISH